MKKHDIQERAFQFACRIVSVHKALARSSSTERTLARQLLRSGTSVGALLEEAHAAESRADFVSKCSVSLKEARESKYWLRLLASCDPSLAGRLDPLIAEAHELISILTAILKKARGAHRTSNGA
ncbi:MAG: four helix bundle protein [Thermoanaerobaculia bacterium]|jgi:four helix bundle protein